MRIDLLTKEYPPEIYGGAGVHVSELVKVLRKTIEVQVRCFGIDRAENDTKSYVHPHEFDESNTAIQTMATDLAMVSDVSGASLVHSHTWYTNFAGQVASQIHGIPHLITAHSLEPLRPWKAEQLGGGYRISSSIERAAYESATGIIAVSNGMKSDILRAYPEIDSTKVQVVHNGIDLAAFKSSGDPDLVRSLGIDPDKRSVVFVGRITKQKGLPYLLRAVRDLPSDVQIVLCAGAPDTKELQQQVIDLVEGLRGARSGVIWIEKHLSRSELIAVLSCATVFACPSIYEPLGIVNLEAMACGTPVVATATGGIPEVVQHELTGLLVPIEQLSDGSGTPIDDDKFVTDTASALNRALSESDLEKMGQAGRERVENFFSWDKIAADTIAIYHSAIKTFA